MGGFTLLEIAYEVANKVGGIYTVLVSKMSYALRSAGQYYAIGPYYRESSGSEFAEEEPPAEFLEAFNEVRRAYGIECHYGRWLVEKKPRAILVDPGRFREKLNEVKGRLWDEHRIDSLQADDWYNDPVIWSKAAGIVIAELVRRGALGGKVIAHFHEWLSGAGLLHLKSSRTSAMTVFTTHSTVLGRTIAETGREDLYKLINSGLDAGRPADDRKAYEYNCQAKHLMEKAAAKNADVFTTVSDIMGRECEFMLGRKPDVILSNGLDMNKFPPMETVFKMHEIYRERIDSFIMGYFLPYYEIDPGECLVFFISGRYEFHNKGIDIFIEALGRLNEELKSGGRKVVVFFWIPAETKGRKPTVVEHLKLFEDLDAAIGGQKVKVEREVIRSFIRGTAPRRSGIFDEEFLRKLKALGVRLKRKEKENPPLTPFNMPEDSITRALEENGLRNGKQDRVRVIFYPAYLSEKDGLLELKYYSAMAGCDLGVFPSCYESWGYTPLETAALGMQAVTTDLSGFGRFIAPQLKGGEASIMVIRRDRRTDDESAAELAELLLRICRMSAEERAASCRRAKELSMLADWGKLYENYEKAYSMALEKAPA